VAHQAKYFASIHEGVPQPWFEALQVRCTPEQIGFNYIPVAFGQHEVRRWFGANNGRGVAVTVDGVDAMAARIRAWVDTNPTSVELAKVPIAFDPVLAALAKAMGPAATTMRLTPAWPITDAELQAAADNFIYSIVPQWAEVEGITEHLDRHVYLDRHACSVSTAQQQLVDWRAPPLPAARGTSNFCNDSADF
jgi:hypothetical protein